MTQIAHFVSMGSLSGYGEKNAGRIPHEKTIVGDIEFDSLAEKDRYLELLVMEKGGIISDLKCHPQWELLPPQKVPGHGTFRKHVYTADFSYVRDGELVVEDVKSERTRLERDYILNRKYMWRDLGIYVEEVIR